MGLTIIDRPQLYINLPNLILNSRILNTERIEEEVREGITVRIPEEFLKKTLIVFLKNF